MHCKQQPTISDIASHFEKNLISTPIHQREERVKELAKEANEKAKEAGMKIDFGSYIPKALAAIERHEAMQEAKQSGH